MPAPGSRTVRRGRSARRDEELRDAGRDHERAELDPGDRLAFLVLALAKAVPVTHLVPVVRRVEQRDAREPLHARHPVPPGNDEPEGEAVLRRKRHAVDLVRQKRVPGEHLGERDAACVVLLLVSLDAAVEPGEEDVARAVGDAGFLEQRPRRACRASAPCRPPRAATAGSRRAARRARARCRRTPS